MGAALLRLVAAERVGIPPATLRDRPHLRRVCEAGAGSRGSNLTPCMRPSRTRESTCWWRCPPTPRSGWTSSRRPILVTRTTSNCTGSSSARRSPRTRLEFLRVWTRKEALLKLSGTGLRTSPTLISLTSGGSPPRLLGAPRELRDAVVDDLDVAESVGSGGSGDLRRAGRHRRRRPRTV